MLEDLPTEAKTTQPVLHLRLRILLFLEEWMKAGFLAEGLLTIDQNDAEAWYGLSVSAAQQGRLDEAKQAIKRAADLNAALKERAIKDDRLAGLW